MKPTYPMSKKAKIQFWVVELYDPTCESYIDEASTTSTHYVRTEEEAMAMVEKHTKEYMPDKPNEEISELRKAYSEWTPYDPQTGEKNEPLPDPPQHEKLPLWTWKYGDGIHSAVANELAMRMDSDVFRTGWNDQTWEGDKPFGVAFKVIIL